MCVRNAFGVSDLVTSCMRVFGCGRVYLWGQVGGRVPVCLCMCVCVRMRVCAFVYIYVYVCA